MNPWDLTDARFKFWNEINISALSIEPSVTQAPRELGTAFAKQGHKMGKNENFWIL